MTTMLGLTLTGRRVLVGGGGPVGTRRVRRPGRRRRPGGARRPAASATPCSTCSHWGRRGREREVVESDLDRAWLVHTATGDPALNAQVAAWSAERPTWCVNASDGRDGTARVAATSTHGDLLSGSSRSATRPSPGRGRRARWRARGVRRGRPAAPAQDAAGSCSSAAARATPAWCRLPGSRPSRPPTWWSPTGSVPRAVLDRLPPGRRGRQRRQEPDQPPRCRSSRSTGPSSTGRCRALTVVPVKGGDLYVFGRGARRCMPAARPGSRCRWSRASRRVQRPRAGRHPGDAARAWRRRCTSPRARRRGAAALAALAAGATVVFLMAVSAPTRHLRGRARGWAWTPTSRSRSSSRGSTARQRVTRARSRPRGTWPPAGLRPAGHRRHGPGRRRWASSTTRCVPRTEAMVGD